MVTKHSEKDFLTGFFLREAFHAFLKEVLLDSRLKKTHFSLLLLDLDHFKKFNDKFGHLFGDEILKYVASTMRLSFPPGTSRIFRYGGDEFLVVLPTSNLKEAVDIVGSFKFNLAHRPFLFKNKLFKITSSCGISGFPADGNTPEELVKKADQAMYFSKRHGRNRTTLSCKINTINMQYMIVLLVSLFLVVGGLFYSYKYALKVPIQKTLNAMSTVRVTTGPREKDMDLILLKNGNVLKGRITSETPETLTMEIFLNKGRATISVKMSEVKSVKRAAITAPPPQNKK